MLRFKNQLPESTCPDAVIGAVSPPHESAVPMPCAGEHFACALHYTVYIIMVNFSILYFGRFGGAFFAGLEADFPNIALNFCEFARFSGLVYRLFFCPCATI